jgi:hypothetical protein
MPEEIEIRLGRIRKKLKQVQRLKPPGFGSESHQYRLRPPLEEGVVIGFERTHEVTLPREFRRFVLELGDGGAGPAYGLNPFRKWSLGFAHQGKSMLASRCLVRSEEDWFRLPAPEGEGSMDLFLDGTIEIVSEGCSFSIHLIVTGDCRGRILRVDTEDDDSPYLTDDPDFLAWYERWLDHLLWGWDASAAGEGLPGTEAHMVERLLDPACPDRIRREALRTLRRIKIPAAEAKQAVLDHLKSPCPAVLAEALENVLKHMWSEADDSIARLLQHPDPGVRLLAVRILGRSKLPRWPELIRPHLNDSDGEVAFIALLAMIESKVIQQSDLEPMIHSQLPERRKTGIWAWGKAGFPITGAPWFADRLRDADIEVARSVILACDDAGDRGILPYLPELTARAAGEFDVLENNVRRNLSNLPESVSGPLFEWRILLKRLKAWLHS